MSDEICRGSFAIAIRINPAHSLIHLRYARQSSGRVSFARLHFSPFYRGKGRSINYGATLGGSAPLTHFYHARKESPIKCAVGRVYTYISQAEIFARNIYSLSLGALFTLCDIFIRPPCRFSLCEKNRTVSRRMNTMPRGKIQIPAASARRGTGN